MIFANLKNGCKRACNLVKNSRAVRFCVLVAVCLTFNVATALAQSGGLLDIHNWDALNVTKSKVTKSRFYEKEKTATSCVGDCGRGEISKFLWLRWRVGRGPCSS